MTTTRMLAAIVLALVSLAATLVLAISGCSRETAAESAYFHEHLSCPAPATEQFEPWGKAGSQHSCKVMHGPFVAFEDRYVRIRGQYENGKKVGVWKWYSPDGRVEKEVNYSTTP